MLKLELKDFVNVVTCIDALGGLRLLPSGSVRCIVTSPPYWGLRNYNAEGQIGLEPTLAEFIALLVEIFNEARRVLTDDGTLWVNMGDSYAHSTKQKHSFRRDRQGVEDGIGLRAHGLKVKDLIGVPWELAFALRNSGWFLRQDIISSKTSCMPESVTDRCTKSHEYIFLFSKKAKYFFNDDAIMEPIAASTAKDARLMNEAYTTGRPERGQLGAPSQGNGMLKPKRSVRDDIDTRGGNQGTGGIPVIGGKGNRKTFRGGGVNTSAQSFHNDTPVPNDSVGNKPSETFLRKKRSVWSIGPSPYAGAHFATFPPELPEICIRAGSEEGDIVLDMFSGAGTTAMVARELGRNFIAFEINPQYVALSNERLHTKLGLFKSQG